MVYIWLDDPADAARFGDRKMSDDAPVALRLIAHQLRQLMTDVGGLREDAHVLTALVRRMDGTLTALLGEVRAMHSQHSRVRDLETRP